MTPSLILSHQLMGGKSQTEMKFPFTSPNNLFFILMFSIAFILRLLATFFLKSWISPKTFEYGGIAQNILSGKGYSFDYIEPGIELTKPFFSWMPPLYPLVLTFFMWIFKNSYFWFLIFQCFISALTCLSIYWIASRIFGYRTGIIAGFTTAIYPLFILIPTKIAPSTFDIFLFSVIFIFLLKANEEKGLFYSAMSGISIGLFSLSQPQMLGFFPLVMFWLSLNKSKRLWLKGLTIGILTLITITPWTVRNYLIHNKLVLISTNGGYNLWLGNNPTSTGTLMRGDFENLPTEVKNSMSTLSETEFTSRLAWAAIGYIKNNPLRYLKLSAKKLYSFWFRPDLGLTQDKARTTIFFPLYIIQNLFLILMGIAGTVLAHNRQRIFSLVYFFMGFYSLIYMIFFAQSRFRWIVDPFLLILLAICINHLIGKFSKYFPSLKWLTPRGLRNTVIRTEDLSSE